MYLRSISGKKTLWSLVAATLLCGCIVGCRRAAPPSAPVRDAVPEAAAIRWLEERSMLHQARQQAAAVSGQGVQWRHPYGRPQPREVVRRASVWLLDYPGSVIPRPGRSVIATWADPELWDVLRDLGIDLLHTGPVKRAGGLKGREYTRSQDGGFDPIALEIDPQLGTEAEYRRLVKVAERHGAVIAGDLVPLHTGTGADFRLALLAHRDYPGMYSMVEIGREDWPLLPHVDGPWTSAPVPRDTAETLWKKGYIPGLIHNNDASPKARDLSGWAASGEVTGTDGRSRRWVYLHYFKPGQPTLNWLDPSYAAPRAVAGDLTWQVHGLGVRVLRFDAVPFLGIEPHPGRALSEHYQHPLAVNSTNEIAFLTRKLGGWSFHELNVPLRQLKQFTAHGPDLSYDFFTRAQCLHALLTGNAAFLRQSFHMLRAAGVDSGSLVHDLQNHDEITYQLVELADRKDEMFTLNGQRATGHEWRERMLHEMRVRAAGAAAPHNRLYRPEQDGVATTFAAFVAAGLGIRDPYHATAQQRAQIRRGHLLLAHANAMQPGVFSLASWDLVGALPIPERAVAPLVADGDYRWINRGGVDLLGANPTATASACGLQKAPALYGPLPEQLKDPDSFASRLKRLLAARKEYRIAEGELLAVLEVQHPGVCLLALRLPGQHPFAITALNFGREAVEEEVNLYAVADLPVQELRGRKLIEVVGGKPVSEIPETGKLRLELDVLDAKTWVVSGGPR